MRAESPAVTVVITTKNEERNIGACLESLTKQTTQDFEVVVVDNQSTDRTKELAAKYTDKVFDKGPERSAQRNFGAEQGRGKFVLYLDADMILSPAAIQTCLDLATKTPGLSGVYIPEVVVGEGYWIKVRRFERSFYDGTVIDAVRFVPREHFLKVGGFDASMSGPEDWDFDKKIRGLGTVLVAPTELYHNEGSFDLAFYLKKKRYYAGDFSKYVAKWGANDPDVRRQLGFLYRYFGVFLERGKFLKLLTHPALTFGMYYLRFRVGLAYLQTQRLQKRPAA